MSWRNMHCTADKVAEGADPPPARASFGTSGPGPGPDMVRSPFAELSYGFTQECAAVLDSQEPAITQEFRFNLD